MPPPDLSLPCPSNHPHPVSAPINLTTPLSTLTPSIRGKTILITGGASGIGLASAKRLYQLGGYVVIGDINAEKGRMVVEEIIAEGKMGGGKGVGRIVFFPCNVMSYESQSKFFLSALAWSPTGVINCVVVNAAVSEVGQLMEDAEFVPGQPPPPPDLTTFHTNFVGALYTIRLAHHYLRHNGNNPKPSTAETTTPDRHILLMGSFSSFLSSPIIPLYSMSKHALLGLFCSLRATSLPFHNVRINLLAPYFVETPLMPKIVRLLLAGQPLIQLDEMAECIVRLVADENVRGRMVAVGPEGWKEDVDVGGTAEEWESFARRIVGALNTRYRARGWWGRNGGLVGDVVKLVGGMVVLGVGAWWTGWTEGLKATT